LVASGGDDKTVRLWDCRSRACVHTFYDHTATVNSVVWHPSGNCLASGSSDQTVKVWDARTMLLLQHYPAHMGAVNSLAFHPRCSSLHCINLVFLGSHPSSGNFLLSGSSDSTVKVFADITNTSHVLTRKERCGMFRKGICFIHCVGTRALSTVWHFLLSAISFAALAMTPTSWSAPLRAIILACIFIIRTAGLEDKL